MTRVHGDKEIRRRSNIKKLKNYNGYRKFLQEDFKNICGYCGKDITVIRHPFEIDHFVPKAIDESRLSDYTNLVFSCKVCNRAKWDKWPTKDKTLNCNDKEGFIDPATAEFDEHLIRDNDGNIKAVTPIGKYMIRELNFEIRPISSIWKASQLSYKKAILTDKIKKDSKNCKKLQEYYEIDQALDSILKLLFNGGN